MIKAAKTLLLVGLVFTIIGTISFAIAAVGLSTFIDFVIKAAEAEAGQPLEPEVVQLVNYIIGCSLIGGAIVSLISCFVTYFLYAKTKTAVRKNDIMVLAILSIVFNGSIFTFIAALILLFAPASEYEIIQ